MARREQAADSDRGVGEEHPTRTLQDCVVARRGARQAFVEIPRVSRPLSGETRKRTTAERGTMAVLRVAVVRQRAEVLSLHATDESVAQGVGAHHEAALARRARLPGSQGRSRSRPFRGPHLAWLPPARNLMCRRPRLPRAPPSAFPPDPG